MINKVIKRPLLTEKTLKDATENIYTFEVDLRSSKPEIAKAIGQAFGVEVKSVRTSIMKGKRRRIRNTPRERKAPALKKAIIKLKVGQKIDVFDKG